MTPTDANPARSASAAHAPMVVASTPGTAAGKPIPILISHHLRVVGKHLGVVAHASRCTIRGADELEDSDITSPAVVSVTQVHAALPAAAKRAPTSDATPSIRATASWVALTESAAIPRETVRSKTIVAI